MHLLLNPATYVNFNALCGLASSRSEALHAEYENEYAIPLPRPARPARVVYAVIMTVIFLLA